MACLWTPLAWIQSPVNFSSTWCRIHNGNIKINHAANALERWRNNSKAMPEISKPRYMCRWVKTDTIIWTWIDTRSYPNGILRARGASLSTELSRQRTYAYLVNSFPPSAAYMRHWMRWALVPVMACRLFGAKPLPEPMLVFFVNCTLGSTLQWNSNQKHRIFHSRTCV